MRGRHAICGHVDHCGWRDQFQPLAAEGELGLIGNDATRIAERGRVKHDWRYVEARVARGGENDAGR